MFTLNTKAKRQESRKSWIGNRQTEIYKDLEILIYDNESNGNIKYVLVIWKGTAGHPIINYWMRSDEHRNREINSAKQSADRRELYNRENKKGKYITQAAKASRTIKNILKKEYPNIKFSVRSENYSMGSSVDVGWFDGIPSKTLDSFLKQFQYGHFDGMTDMYEYSNVSDMPQAKYVFANREISKEKNELIGKELARLMGIEYSENAVIPDVYIGNVRGYNSKAPLHALVYQISVDFDFSKGFTGVRRKQHEDGQIISNLFEIY